MMNLCRKSAGALLLLVLFCGTAEAGWVIASRYAGRGGSAGTATTSFQRDQVREESPDSVHVMDFRARRILWIQPKEKKYSVMTFDEFRKMMREAMENARKAREEMKRLGMPAPGGESRPRGKVSVKKISGATIAGYACDGYGVAFGGTAAEEIWLTKKIDLSSEIGPGTMREFEDLSQEFRRMGMSADESPEDPEYRKLMESGYPMKVVDLQAGSTHEVTKAERKPLDASLFEEPKGYAKVPYKSMFGDLPETPSGTGQAADYGRQAPGKVKKEEAEEGAKPPVEEKKGDALDGIGEGAKEGIKKLFKW